MAEPSQGSPPRNAPSKDSAAPPERPRGEELPARAARVAQSAADATLEFVEEAAHSALDSFEKQRDLAASTLERLSNALGFVGADAGTENARVARVIGRTGNHVRRAAEYVSAATPGGLKRDLTHLTRTRTGVAVSGFFLAGVALGRFLHATQSKGPEPQQLDLVR